jgi:hypothetical protein
MDILFTTASFHLLLAALYMSTTIGGTMSNSGPSSSGGTVNSSLSRSRWSCRRLFLPDCGVYRSPSDVSEGYCRRRMESKTIEAAGPGSRSKPSCGSVSGAVSFRNFPCLCGCARLCLLIVCADDRATSSFRPLQCWSGIARELLLRSAQGGVERGRYISRWCQPFESAVSTGVS